MTTAQDYAVLGFAARCEELDRDDEPVEYVLAA